MAFYCFLCQNCYGALSQRSAFLGFNDQLNIYLVTFHPGLAQLIIYAIQLVACLFFEPLTSVSLEKI